jgi:hypothetical protein
VSRPIGVTLLAILAALAGLAAAVHTLQYLHLVPFMIGPVAFFGFDPLGALLWGLTTAIWAWVTVNLWLVRPQALQFVTILSGLNLILAGISVLGASTLSAMAPAILFNGIILIYSLSPRIRESFGMP